MMTRSTRRLATATATLIVLAGVPALAQPVTKPASPAPATPPAAAPVPAPPAAVPATPAPAVAAPAATPPVATPYKPIAPAGDILATLQASGEFKIFVQAAQATNIATILKTQPGITVFAPPDSAFSSMPADQLAALQKNIPELQKLVTYHIVNTHITAAQVIGHASTSIPTVATLPVALAGEGGKMTVNGANVLQPDVTVSNGVIFVIDQVLQPGAAPPAAAAPK